MSCYSKEKIERNNHNNICKSHTARSDRELYRICPSKLSKRELEDLYFSLLENNLDLKRTINGQQDKIRGLSTKVQRMTSAQKTVQAKEMKECCVGTKSIVTEQKESITELKRTNQRLAERIRQLNMRLCSAKQFFKKSPQPSTSRCIRCATASSPKKDPVSVRSAQTETRDLEKLNADECDENKCRTLMEELTQKIVFLQEELCTVHEEYSSRIGHLEKEVSEVRKENIRVSSERRASEHELHRTVKRNSELLANFRTAEAKCAELSTELSIEKRKVAELETRLKAANISDRVNKTIEDHLTTIQDTNGQPQGINELSEETKVCATPNCVCACPPCPTNEKGPKNASKCVTCACPLPHEGESITPTSSKPIPIKSNQSKTTTSKNGLSNSFNKTASNGTSIPTTDSKCVSCGCPPHRDIESTPKALDYKCVICACHPEESPPAEVVPTKKTQCVICACPLPEETSIPAKDSKCVMCACPPEKILDISAPAKDLNGRPESQEGELFMSTPTKESKCVNCACTQECQPLQSTQHEALRNEYPTENRRLSPNVGDTTRWSPRAHHEEENMSKADDSGYVDCNKSQDTVDEVGLNKLNKELIRRILELQNEVDSMKIAGASDLSGAQQRRLSETTTLRNSDEPVSKSGKKKEKIKTSDNGEQNKAESVPGTSLMAEEIVVSKEMASAKPYSGLFEDYRTNKSDLQPVTKVPMTEDTAEKSTKDATGRPKMLRTEEHRPSKTDTPYLVNHDDEHNKSESVPGKLTRQTSDEQRPSKLESGCSDPKLDKNEYRGSDNIIKNTTEERRPSKLESGFSYRENDHRGPNNTDVVSKNIKMSEIIESMPSPAISEYGERAPKSAKNENLGSSKMELSNENLKLLEAGVISIPSNPELGFAIAKLERNDGEPNKTELANQSKKQAADDHLLSKTELIFGTKRNGEKRLSNNAEMLSSKLPVTEGLAAKLSTLVKPTDEATQRNQQDATISKEGCELCPACTYEKECSSPTHNNNHDSKRNLLGNKLTQAFKNDRHNSLQIPGPIPTAGSNTKDWKKNIFRRSSVDKKKKESHKNNSSKQRTDSLNKGSTNKDKPTKDTQNRNSENKDEKNLNQTAQKQSTNGKEENFTSTQAIDLPNVSYHRKNEITHMSEEHGELDDGMRPNLFSRSRDSIETHQKRFSVARRNSLIKGSNEGPMLHEAMPDIYTHSEHMQPVLQKNQEQSTQVEDNLDKKPPEHTIQAQNNIEPASAPRSSPAACKRDVSVYRRSSGTLCFRTLPVDDPRVCHCKEQADGQCGGKPRDKGIQVQGQDDSTPKHEGRKSSISEHGTYTMSSKQTRSTSPDNTEYEMSYISDLPLEKEDFHKSQGKRALSPGEEKMTTTYTDSYCSPGTNYSLSEGELPATCTRKKSYDKEKQDKAPPDPETASSQKMEAALQAITEELARCKNLLNSQRPTENKRTESSQSQSSLPDEQSIALRRGVARQSIGDAYAPKCIFTLHIGTVVLSDEAILNSNNKTLVLTWKFYDQNIAMTRMRAGRVVLFDFSTEYDIKITDDFLRYMKYEEMPIVICELDKENEPFASCTLPLRDALLHTNRRADMSLALVAGPQMISARAAYGAAADALDAGDEMGVIDLWCMLRADTNMLPGINRAIAQVSPPTHRAHHRPRNNSRVMQQIVDDDHSNDYVELDIPQQKRNAVPVSVGEQTGKNDCKDVVYERTSRRWTDMPRAAAAPTAVAPTAVATTAVAPTAVATTAVATTAVSDAHSQTAQAATTQTAPVRDVTTYDASKYPAMRPRTSETGSASTPKLLAPPVHRDIMLEDPEHDGSGIIVNEVEAKIKSSGDMKQALEKNSVQNEFTRFPKTEDDDRSQAPSSSVGSFRSIMARLQRGTSARFARRESPQRSTLMQSMRRVSKIGADNPHQTPKTGKEERRGASQMEIYRKYENISKMIGSNRTSGSKKCVTIVPKYIEPVLDGSQRELVGGQQSDVEDQDRNIQCLDITVLWLALNEECEAMIDPHVHRLYVAYTFLGRAGAELETPVSLPKPKHYVDKCYFNFKKMDLPPAFELEDNDLPMLGHMARCRAASKFSEDERDCIVFSVVSEPPEDPLGLESCEDIGHAYLYLGDLLAYSADSPGYTEVVPVRAARGAAAVCGVLAVRLDGLDVVRRCLQLNNSLLNSWSHYKFLNFISLILLPNTQTQLNFNWHLSLMLYTKKT